MGCSFYEFFGNVYQNICPYGANNHVACRNIEVEYSVFYHSAKSYSRFGKVKHGKHGDSLCNREQNKHGSPLEECPYRARSKGSDNHECRKAQPYCHGGYGAQVAYKHQAGVCSSLCRRRENANGMPRELHYVSRTHYDAGINCQINKKKYVNVDCIYFYHRLPIAFIKF